MVGFNFDNVFLIFHFSHLWDSVIPFSLSVSLFSKTKLWHWKKEKMDFENWDLFFGWKNLKFTILLQRQNRSLSPPLFNPIFQFPNTLSLILFSLFLVSLLSLRSHKPYFCFSFCFWSTLLQHSFPSTFMPKTLLFLLLLLQRVSPPFLIRPHFRHFWDWFSFCVLGFHYTAPSVNYF